MSVQISTGEINGTRHVIRTSIGWPYVVMENAGSVEVWRGYEEVTYYFDGSVTPPSSAFWTDEENTVDGSISTFGYTDTEGSFLESEGTNAPGSGGVIISGRVRAYSSTNGGSVSISVHDLDDGQLAFISVTSGTPVWSDWVTIDVPDGGWSWATVQAFKLRCFGFTGGDDHRVYRVEIELAIGSDNPTIFTQMDAANSPACMADAPVSVAIDSGDVLHIVYVAGVASAEDLDYVTFDTLDSTSGDDLFNTPEEAISMEDADNTSWGCAIAIDTNDIPHAVVIGTDADMGTDIHTLYYDNNIGGAWADRREIAGVSDSAGAYAPDIAIDSDNFPVISYIQTGVPLRVVIGNANDPTAFTQSPAIDTTSSVSSGTSLCVDSSGNVWIAYQQVAGATGPVYIAKQSANWTDAWSTYSNSNDGTVPSIVADGTDIYVFYEEDASDDIVYDKYDGSWLGETSLQTSVAYNSVKARWAYFHNPPAVHFESTGGTINPLYGGSGGSGETDQALGVSFTTGSEPVNVRHIAIQAYDIQGAPTDNTYIELASSIGGAAIATSADIDQSTFSADDWVKFSFSSYQALSANTQYFVRLFRDGVRDASNYTRWLSSTGAERVGEDAYARDNNSWGIEDADDSFELHVVSEAPTGLSGIDYIFDDGTNIHWDVLTLGAVVPYVPKIMMLI